MSEFVTATIESHTSIVYRCRPGVRWAVEMAGTVVVNTNTGAAVSLGYPQAAVWDLIGRYPGDRAVDMLAAIASLERPDAEKLVHDCLEAWTAAGFLVREGPHG